MKRLAMLAMLFVVLFGCRTKLVLLEVTEPTTQVGTKRVAMAEPVPTPQQHFTFPIPPDLSTSETLQYLRIHYPEWEFRPDLVSVGSAESRLMYMPYGHFPLANRGDLNDDSERNILDALELVALVLGRREATYHESRAGDCDGNRELNIIDVLEIVKRILDRT